MIKTGVLGFGNVGRELVIELLKLRDIKLVAVASSKGYVSIVDETDSSEIISLARSNSNIMYHSEFVETSKSYRVFIDNRVDLVFIAIPPSYETGEPNRRIYYELVDNDISIITADKTILAIEYSKLMSRVCEKNLFIGYRATVSAGTPVIDVVKALRNRGVERIRGVLNSTCNYIVSLLEKGFNYSEAIDKAVKDKFAEPDPRLDTHGWDPGAKLVILVSTLGYNVSIHDVVRIPLDTVNESSFSNVLNAGYRYKYLAEADLVNKKYTVYPALIPINDRIANIHETYNIVELSLENEKIFVEGPAGPAWRTARVMLADLLDYIAFRETLERK